MIKPAFWVCKAEDQRLARVCTPRSTSTPRSIPTSQVKPWRITYLQGSLMTSILPVCYLTTIHTEHRPAAKTKRWVALQGAPGYVVCSPAVLSPKQHWFEALQLWWNQNQSFTEKCTGAELFAFSLFYSIEKPISLTRNIRMGSGIRQMCDKIFGFIMY